MILTEVDCVPFLVEHDVVPVDRVQPEYIHFESDVLMPQPACPGHIPAPDSAGPPADGELDGDEADSERELVDEDDEVVPSESALGAKPGTPEEANTLSHLMTHFPQNVHCETCNLSRIQRRRKLKGSLALGPKPKEFGDQITVDELICRSKDSKDPAILAELRLDREY